GLLRAKRCIESNNIHALSREPVDEVKLAGLITLEVCQRHLAIARSAEDQLPVCLPIEAQADIEPRGRWWGANNDAFAKGAKPVDGPLHRGQGDWYGRIRFQELAIDASKHSPGGPVDARVQVLSEPARQDHEVKPWLARYIAHYRFIEREALFRPQPRIPPG